MSGNKDKSPPKSDANVTVAVSQPVIQTCQPKEDDSLDSSAVFSKITESLFLTGIDGITESNFQKHGITCDINISQTEDDNHPNGVDYLFIRLHDDEKSNIAVHFDTAAEKIHTTAEKGGKTVVHCMVGMSRSVTLTIAYLIKYRKMNLREAFNYIHERRPIVRPNNGFFRQLIEYEKKILGKQSVKMITIKKHGFELDEPDFFVKEHPKIIEEDFQFCLS